MDKRICELQAEAFKIEYNFKKMFEVGELIKRKSIAPKARATCVVVDKDENNYTVYNNSLKRLQLVAVPVIEGLYNSIVDDGG